MNPEDQSDRESAADIIVLERHMPDYRWHRRGIEKVLADEANDADFARWLADPKSGRFLVLDYLEDSIESMVRNANTEQELIEIVAGKIVLQLTQRGHTPSLSIHVSSEIAAKLNQLCAEITAISNGRDPMSAP